MKKNAKVDDTAQPEEGKIVCIQCKRKKCTRHFKVLRGERREVCDSCAAKNAREVQTRKLRRECCPEGKMKMCGDVSTIEGDLKWCGACDTVHSINEFKKGHRYKDGHGSKCMTCIEGKVSIMSKAILKKFRIAKAECVSDLKVVVDEVLADVPANHDSLNDLEKAVEVVELIETAKDIAGDVKETVAEVKGWWANIKAAWKGWFK